MIEAGDFFIAGAIRLADYNPSFGLTVVRRVDDEGCWVQIIAPNSGRVQGFKRLSSEDSSDVNSVGPKTVKIGSPYIFAFIDKNGGLHLGSAKDLRVEFNIALVDPRTSTATKLAISECVADRSRSREFRKQLEGEFEAAFGRAVAGSFVNSMARSQLWDLLESVAIDKEALKRIQDTRPRITVKVSKDDVEVDLGDLDLNDVSIDFKDIQERLREEFVGGGGFSDIQVTDLSGLPSSDDPTVVTILAAVERSPRQEERLAIILRSLILYPDVAKQMIERYHDRAKMAGNAVDVLRTVLLGSEAFEREEGRVFMIARLIPKFFADAYPRNRGELLYYLSAHLFDFPVVAEEIRALVNKTNAMDVVFMKGRIFEMLDKRGGNFQPVSNQGSFRFWEGE